VVSPASGAPPRCIRQEGQKWFVAGRRDEAGKALVKELRSLGSEAEFINADVRKEEESACRRKTITRFGRLDVAVNNAATEGQVGRLPTKLRKAMRDIRHECSRRAVMQKHEVRVMQKQGSGNIVNISSTYGHEGAACFRLRG